MSFQNKNKLQEKQIQALISSQLKNSADTTNNGEQNPAIVDLFGRKSVNYYKQTIPVSTHHFYLIEEISDDISFYIDMINTLKVAEAHDIIYIYLNTPGGALTTTQQILASMAQTQATVITVLEGEVCSAGTFIFLAGDVQIVNGNCTFMIHNFSQILGGKGNEITAQLTYSNIMFDKLVKFYYKEFLTDDELDKLREGKDFWMDSDKVLVRLLSYKDPDTVQYINCGLSEDDIENILSTPKRTQEYLEEDIIYRPKKTKKE